MAHPAASEARTGPAAARGFGELEEEVIKPGRCTECRACIDMCLAEGAEALDLDLGSFAFRPDRCTDCGLCYAVCPEVPWAWRDLQDRYRAEVSDIGEVKLVSSATTRNAQVKRGSADGGVATSILLYLLDSGQIEGAVVSGDGGPVGPNFVVARTRDDVVRAAGLRAGRGASLASRNGLVTNLDTMNFLRRLHTDDPESRDRLALVGTPCQTYTVRRMQQIGVAPAPRITTVLGLFCYEALPLDKVRWQRFEAATGLHVEDIDGVQLREELVLTMRDGRTERVDLDTSSLLAGPNCLRCTDFSCRFADLSLGAVGSEPGFTTVVVRTERGRRVFEGALEAGYITDMYHMYDMHRGTDAETASQKIRERLERQTRRKVEFVRKAGGLR